MPTTYYHTINGRIVGQTKNGVRTHFVPDALGSVVATLDANGTVENTYRYKPYGSLLAKTGTGDDPRFLWVGAFGYRRVISIDLSYMRARHYSAVTATFTAPVAVTGQLVMEPPFGYAAASPTNAIDPEGLWPCLVTRCCCCPQSIYTSSILFHNVFDGIYGCYHSFIVKMPLVFLQRAGVGPTTDCQLEWHEKASITNDWNPVANVWSNVRPRFPNDPAFDTWNHEKPCPGRVQPYMPDAPGIRAYLGIPRSRKLCIKVVVRAAPDCGCPDQSLYIYQHVSYTFNAQGNRHVCNDKTLSFHVDGDPRLPSYCKGR